MWKTDGDNRVFIWLVSRRRQGRLFLFRESDSPHLVTNIKLEHLSLSDRLFSKLALIMFVRIFTCITLCLSLTAALAQNPAISSKHFKIREATQQAWSPGIVRENTTPAGGQIYQLSIKVRRGGQYQVERLIVNGESIPIETTQRGEARSTERVRKCSKWEFMARSSSNNPQPMSNEIRNVLDRAGASDAWILYQFEGSYFLAAVPNVTMVKADSPNQ